MDHQVRNYSRDHREISGIVNLELFPEHSDIQGTDDRRFRSAYSVANIASGVFLDTKYPSCPRTKSSEQGFSPCEPTPGNQVIFVPPDSGWLVYKAVQKAKTPDTSFVLTNVVYPYPDLWICPYISYGCDTLELEKTCTESVTMTEGGEPYAAFYPRVKLGHEHQEAAEELRIEAIPTATDVFDSDGNKLRGRGHCVVFKTSEATAFVGEPRDPHEYLDFIHLDMYWYPGGENVTSTTCVPEGQEWADHREWVYAFLSDPNDVTSTSTGIQLSYSCITNTSNTHVFNTLELGLTNQNKFASDDIASYKAIFTNFGLHKNLVNPNITHPYARVSLEMKQQLDSWEIITEANPFEFAEMFGNIGGFWDLLLILWPLFFVAATQQDPHLKPRTFRKSVIRGAERAAGVTKVIARSVPKRRDSLDGASSGVEGFDEEERPHWERQPVQRQPASLTAANWQNASQY